LNIPDRCLAAVFEGVGKPLRMESFALEDPLPGHVLAKVRMATICGSDLHTVSGRRVESTPLVLGHEIVGEVAALGEGIRETSAGDPLRVGDRVTFTIMASCGRCPNCRAGIPQKCRSLFKYGHTCINDGLPLSGGLAEYVYLRPGTSVFHVPSSLSDKAVCPANCALATVVNGLEAIAIRPGERVLVQGAGLLGPYAVALLKDRGAGEVVVTDLDGARLDMAANFGADETVNVAGMSADDVVDMLGEMRFDCGVEVCGDPSVVWPGIRTLALKGRYVIMGLVCAGSLFTIDGNTVTRNYLTITGVHNYAPKHLAAGLAFLERTCSRFPYQDLVSEVLQFSEAEEAFKLAAEKRGIRVAVVP